MFGTKIEIKMKKAEPGAWSSLEIPKSTAKGQDTTKSKDVENLTPKIDAVDLSDL